MAEQLANLINNVDSLVSETFYSDNLSYPTANTPIQRYSYTIPADGKYSVTFIATGPYEKLVSVYCFWNCTFSDFSDLSKVFNAGTSAVSTGVSPTVSLSFVKNFSAGDTLIFGSQSNTTNVSNDRNHKLIINKIN